MRTPIQHNEDWNFIENSEDPQPHMASQNNVLLNKLKYFHTCKFGLPLDAMHDLLEGYVKLCTILLLKQFIDIYFKLSDVDNAIQNFKYSPSEAKCKPKIITSKEMPHS